MASRTARLAAVATLVLAAAACTKSLDTDGLEATAAGHRSRRRPAARSPASIVPMTIKVETGSTFECTATEESGATFTLEVVQTDDAGNVSWRSRPQPATDLRHGAGSTSPEPAPGGSGVLLEDKKLLITGVLTPQSIAFAAARAAQEQGAEIVLTNFGRTVSLTEKTAQAAPHHARRARDGRQRPRPDRRRLRGAARRGGAGSTGSCTRSRSRRRTRWVGTSSTRRGTAWRPRSRRARSR